LEDERPAGQSVFSKGYNLANGELKAELDLSAVGKGLYLVQVRSEPGQICTNDILNKLDFSP